MGLPAILAHVPNGNKRLGGIAQLGERLTGSQEVSGSIPLISTKDPQQNCCGSFPEKQFTETLISVEKSVDKVSCFCYNKSVPFGANMGV